MYSRAGAICSSDTNLLYRCVRWRLNDQEDDTLKEPFSQEVPETSFFPDNNITEVPEQTESINLNSTEAADSDLIDEISETQNPNALNRPCEKWEPDLNKEPELAFVQNSKTF